MALALGACAADPADEAAAAAESPPPLVLESPTPAEDASPTDLPLIVETPAAPSASEATTGAATIATGDAGEYGTVLTDGDGMTLYVFLDDADGESTCYDTCADTWPPVLADSDPVADVDVDEALLGTTQREDGAEQVTYGGQPLYRYQGDSAPGDVNGFGSGGAWYPVAADGTPIDEEAGADESADGAY
jgi:predicted lipoprotein with Yx(FWY)xxD motif